MQNYAYVARTHRVYAAPQRSGQAVGDSSGALWTIKGFNFTVRNSTNTYANVVNLRGGLWYTFEYYKICDKRICLHAECLGAAVDSVFFFPLLARRVGEIEIYSPISICSHNLLSPPP